VNLHRGLGNMMLARNRLIGVTFDQESQYTLFPS
jgi:hypothetical protein